MNLSVETATSAHNLIPNQGKNNNKSTQTTRKKKKMATTTINDKLVLSHLGCVAKSSGSSKNALVVLNDGIAPCQLTSDTSSYKRMIGGAVNIATILNLFGQYPITTRLVNKTNGRMWALFSTENRRQQSVVFAHITEDATFIAKIAFPSTHLVQDVRFNYRSTGTTIIIDYTAIAMDDNDDKHKPTMQSIRMPLDNLVWTEQHQEIQEQHIDLSTGSLLCDEQAAEMMMVDVEDPKAAATITATATTDKKKMTAEEFTQRIADINATFKPQPSK